MKNLFYSFSIAIISLFTGAMIYGVGGAEATLTEVQMQEVRATEAESLYFYTYKNDKTGLNEEFPVSKTEYEDISVRNMQPKMEGYTFLGGWANEYKKVAPVLQDNQYYVKDGVQIIKQGGKTITKPIPMEMDIATSSPLSWNNLFKTKEAWAAIATTTTGVKTGSSVSSLTLSITISGSNTYLVVDVDDYTSPTGIGVNNVKYAGVTMTKIGERQRATTDTLRVYDLVAPTAGTNNIVVTYSGTAQYPAFWAVAYSGVAQTNTYSYNTGNITSTAFSAAATSYSFSTTTVVDNQWMIVNLSSNISVPSSCATWVANMNAGSMLEVCKPDSYHIADRLVSTAGSATISSGGGVANGAYAAVYYAIRPVATSPAAAADTTDVLFFD